MASDPFLDAGAAVRKFLSSDGARATQQAANAAAVRDTIGMFPGGGAINYALPAMSNFFSGLMGGQRQAQPQKAAVAKPAPAKPAPQAAAKPADQQPAQPAGSPTFDQMLAAYSKANGDKISLREMSALADIAAKTTAPHHVPSIADIAGQQALTLGDQLMQYKMEQAKAVGDKNAYYEALQEGLDRRERIARARAIDPVSAAQLGD